MSELPPPQKATEDDLARWYAMQDQLKALKASEMLLRRKIFFDWFETKEGVQKYPLADGYTCKGELPYEYKMDEASFDGLKEQFVEKGLPVDSLVRWKPELAKRAYNELTAEQKAIFDQCLTIKPSTPSMEIVPPANPKGKRKPPPTIAPQGQENL